MEETLITLMGSVLESIEDMKTKINSPLSNSEKPNLDKNLNELVKELKSELLRFKSIRIQTKLFEKDALAIQMISLKIEKLNSDLSLINFKEINTKISKLQEMVIIKRVESSRSFVKFSYWLNGIAIISITATLFFANWWISTKTVWAKEEMQNALEIKKSYEGFPNPAEWNWYVGYHNYFNKLHPKDSYNWKKSNPFPIKK